MLLGWRRTVELVHSWPMLLVQKWWLLRNAPEATCFWEWNKVNFPCACMLWEFQTLSKTVKGDLVCFSGSCITVKNNLSKRVLTWQQYQTAFGQAPRRPIRRNSPTCGWRRNPGLQGWSLNRFLKHSIHKSASQGSEFSASAWEHGQEGFAQHRSARRPKGKPVV